jgi:hypothetical protein
MTSGTCKLLSFPLRPSFLSKHKAEPLYYADRWDETKAPGSVGLEQKYEYVDMLGVCAWLNLLVRKHKDVGIACIAQSVNVVSTEIFISGLWWNTLLK